MTDDEALAFARILRDVSAGGYTVNNLFQLPYNTSRPGARWQANLTMGEAVWEFGQGDTPGAALGEALAKVKDPPGYLRGQGPMAPVQVVDKRLEDLDL